MGLLSFRIARLMKILASLLTGSSWLLPRGSFVAPWEALNWIMASLAASWLAAASWLSSVRRNACRSFSASAASAMLDLSRFSTSLMFLPSCFLAILLRALRGLRETGII